MLDKLRKELRSSVTQWLFWLAVMVILASAYALAKTPWQIHNGEEENYMQVELEDRTVTLDIQADLALSDDTLNDDMCALAQKTGMYAEIMGEAYTYALNLKHEADVTEAHADQDIRAAAQASGDKTTEPAIKQKVVLDHGVRAARRAFYAADGQHRTVEGAYRALRDKGNLAIAICYKQKEEIRVMNSPIG